MIPVSITLPNHLIKSTCWLKMLMFLTDAAQRVVHLEWKELVMKTFLIFSSLWYTRSGTLQPTRRGIFQAEPAGDLNEVVRQRN